MLISFNDATIVEIFQDHSHELLPRCGYGDVQQYYCCRQGGTLCGRHSIKLEAIPSHSQADTVISLFIRLNFSQDPSISYLFVFWHSFFFIGENCVVYSWNYGTKPLGQPEQVVCECLFPYFYIRATEEGREFLIYYFNQIN